MGRVSDVVAKFLLNCSVGGRDRQGGVRTESMKSNMKTEEGKEGRKKELGEQRG